MEKFFTDFLARIDAVILVLVLLSGFFQKKYLSGIVLSKTKTTDGALKTLLVSFVVSLIWIVLKRDGNAHAYSDYFITYFFGTSLYELIVKPFEKFIKSSTSDTKQ